MLTIGGVVLGAVLTAAYERWKERRSATRVRLLLSREISDIRSNLKEVIEVLEAFPANELPPYIKPMTIDELRRDVRWRQ